MFAPSVCDTAGVLAGDPGRRGAAPIGPDIISDRRDARPVHRKPDTIRAMPPIRTSPRVGEMPALSWPDTAEAAAERAAVAAGRLPPRYADRWEEAFLT